MIRRTNTIRMTIALTAVGCALSFTACGAGRVTQTDSQVAAVSGATGDAGSIAVRNARLAHPGGSDGEYAVYEEGDDAALLLTIVNAGGSADELVSITTPAAADVSVSGPTTIAAGRSITAADEPSGGAVALPRPGGVAQDDDTLRIELTDLTAEIRPGLPTEITLTFADAGSMTLRVPVDNTDVERGD